MRAVGHTAEDHREMSPAEVSRLNEESRLRLLAANIRRTVAGGPSDETNLCGWWWCRTDGPPAERQRPWDHMEAAAKAIRKAGGAPAGHAEAQIAREYQIYRDWELSIEGFAQLHDRLTAPVDGAEPTRFRLEFLQKVDQYLREAREFGPPGRRNKATDHVLIEGRKLGLGYQAVAGVLFLAGMDRNWNALKERLKKAAASLPVPGNERAK